MVFKIWEALKGDRDEKCLVLILEKLIYFLNWGTSGSSGKVILKDGYPSVQVLCGCQWKKFCTGGHQGNCQGAVLQSWCWQNTSSPHNEWHSLGYPWRAVTLPQYTHPERCFFLMAPHFCTCRKSMGPSATNFSFLRSYFTLKAPPQKHCFLHENACIRALVMQPAG